jgi:hypothetical protein
MSIQEKQPNQDIYLSITLLSSQCCRVGAEIKNYGYGSFLLTIDLKKFYRKKSCLPQQFLYE